MKLEEALQIAMEELDGSAESLKRLYESYEHKIDDECRRFQIARETLEQQLRRADSEREWVGLTRVEEAVIIEEWRMQEGKPARLCHMIEAKLKERNT